MKRALATAILLWALGVPAFVLANATIADYSTPPLQQTGSTIAQQHPAMIRALQAMGAYFSAKVSSGTEPLDVLQCVQLGLRGQSSTRLDWRLCTTSDDAAVFEQNVANDAAPVWAERFRVNATGPTSAPAAHTHPASDVVSGAFADARISQTSVEQWGTAAPTVNRLVKYDGSAQIAQGAISQASVTQYEGALSLSGTQLTSGTVPSARISQASVDQHGSVTGAASRMVKGTAGGKIDDTWIAATSVSQFGFVLPTNAIFLWTATATCPTGSAEATTFRNITIRGADSLAGNADVPNTPGITCGNGAAPAGCGAVAGAAAYDDVPTAAEMFAHAHGKQILAHQHDVVLGSHQHDWFRERSNPDITAPGASSVQMVGDTDGGGGVDLVPSAGTFGVDTTNLGTKTSTANGADSGNTTSVGSSFNHLHGFRTVLFCAVL